MEIKMCRSKKGSTLSWVLNPSATGGTDNKVEYVTTHPGGGWQQNKSKQKHQNWGPGAKKKQPASHSSTKQMHKWRQTAQFIRNVVIKGTLNGRGQDTSKGVCNLPCDT